MYTQETTKAYHRTKGDQIDNRRYTKEHTLRHHLSVAHSTRDMFSFSPLLCYPRCWRIVSIVLEQTVHRRKGHCLEARIFSLSVCLVLQHKWHFGQ